MKHISKRQSLLDINSYGENRDDIPKSILRFMNEKIGQYNDPQSITQAYINYNDSVEIHGTFSVMELTMLTWLANHYVKNDQPKQVA